MRWEYTRHGGRESRLNTRRGGRESRLNTRRGGRESRLLSQEPVFDLLAGGGVGLRELHFDVGLVAGRELGARREVELGAFRGRQAVVERFAELPDFELAAGNVDEEAIRVETALAARFGAAEIEDQAVVESNGSGKRA